MSHPHLRAAALALGVALGVFVPARGVWAQKLVRDYRFKLNLQDSANQGPELKPLGGTVNDGSYSFGAGQGLQLEKTGVTDHYAVEISFRFDDVADWQKIVDFKRRASDNGLYVLNGMLQFYDFGIGGDVQSGQEYRIRLERDRNTNVVRGFVNDQKAFEFNDTNADAVFDGEHATFFADDTTTGGEEAPGAVTRIRIWDGPEGK